MTGGKHRHPSGVPFSIRLDREYGRLLDLAVEAHHQGRPEYETLCQCAAMIENLLHLQAEADAAQETAKSPGLLTRLLTRLLPGRVA